jgi:hypothetical protein
MCQDCSAPKVCFLVIANQRLTNDDNNNNNILSYIIQTDLEDLSNYSVETVEEPVAVLAATFPPYVERANRYDDLTLLLTPQSLPQSREIIRNLFEIPNLRDIPLANTIKSKRSRLGDVRHI